MRNFTKILCVVLALVVALAAASCSLTKQYSYKTDDVELPIGVYIYYLQSAYYDAQELAQKSDKYDSEAKTYDGEKSFLKMEITDEDGNTAVAEDWIKTRAEKYMNEAVAVYYEYNKLGCTMDEASIAESRSAYKDYWDNGYEYYGNTQPALSETYEPLGIGFDSFFLAVMTIPQMSSVVFEAEYAVDGPSAVSDEELSKYFEENYTSYHYFSADLYTTVEAEDEDDEDETVALSEAEINAITASFDSYAAEIASGTSFSDVLAKYNEAYSASATATEKVEKIDAEDDSLSELMKAIAGLKSGEAQQIVIGDSETSRKIYLIYKEPITDVTEHYISEHEHRDSIVSDMKGDDYTELLKVIAAAINIDKSSAIKDYKPSMFES